ncbi:MAG: tRNA threonylcarbamoyladenosine dehydratase [Clostridia bacterium]|nr:tRNA threonylcarbamoyladenosine dehydratase [Clostridia bacterium]
MEDKKEGFLSRTTLLLGEQAVSKLGATRVAIFGIGGVGGYALEALVRSGVGHITVIDSDTVSDSNLNRQIIATRDTVGRVKVEVAKERAKSINPDCDVRCIEGFYPDCEVDLSEFDYIIDAIDSVNAKCTLIERATALGIPIISSMGTAGKLDPTALTVSDIYKTSTCPLARSVRGELKRRGVKRLKVVYSTEISKSETVEDKITGATYTRRVPGSVIFVPAAAGLILASEVVRDIIS